MIVMVMVAVIVMTMWHVADNLMMDFMLSSFPLSDCDGDGGGDCGDDVLTAIVAPSSAIVAAHIILHSYMLCVCVCVCMHYQLPLVCVYVCIISMCMCDHEPSPGHWVRMRIRSGVGEWVESED